MPTLSWHRFVPWVAIHAFWNHTLDGLAVFATPRLFEVHRLQRSVAEFAVVADSFHVKPVIRFLQSADRFQVLGLSGSTVRLFEGSRDTLDEKSSLRVCPRRSRTPSVPSVRSPTWRCAHMVPALVADVCITVAPDDLRVRAWDAIAPAYTIRVGAAATAAS